MSNSIYINPQLFGSPSNLKLQQTITSSGNVNIPNGIKKVWAVLIGGGGGGSYITGYVPSPTISSGIVGGSITSASLSTPSAGLVTYYTGSIVPIGSTVTISGFTPTNYNGTFFVTSSNPGVSFTVVNTLASSAVTVNGVFTNLLYITLTNQPYLVGDPVTISGALPAGVNGSYFVAAIDQNVIILRPSVSLSVAANTTLTTVGTIYLSKYGAGSGGGAGGFTCGWVSAESTCIVGSGGIGGTSSINPTKGGYSMYGTLIAGGGGAAKHNRLSSVNVNSSGLGGAVGGTIDNAASAGLSFTGGPYVGASNLSGLSSVAGVSAVSGSGGNGFYTTTTSQTTANQTIGNGGSGLIGGGAGGGQTTGVITAGNGGSGYNTTGGLGSSGTGYSFGGGGGGGGFISNGGNASGINGGDGGLGGGGGGGGGGSGNGGNGGNGVILLYY